MRSALWLETFRDGEAEAAYDRVVAVIESIVSRSEQGQVAFMSLAQFLQRHRELARDVLMPLATASGHVEILSILVDENPLKKPGPRDLDPPRLNDARDVTLGERRSMARRPDRDILSRLVMDPDPQVIRILMLNPRVVEADILRIASRRPNSAEVLTEVFRHPKWVRRQVVRLALILNPYSPLEISLGLLGLLNRAELRTVSREQSIHPILRGQARGRHQALIERRSEKNDVQMSEPDE
jgi:hypothetical protein